MTKIHNNLPTHKGELDLARKLSNLVDDKLHLWFGINYLPMVNDIDTLLVHEHIGAFIIEVKAIPIDQINHFDGQKVEIKGRQSILNPNYQAQKAMYSLKNRLDPRMKLPYIHVTSCWPKINRCEWIEYWDDKEVQKLSSSMIFADDIFTPEGLIERLQYIIHNPPIGAATKLTPTRPSLKMIDDLDKNLKIESLPKKIPSDEQRLRAIEGKIYKSLQDRAEMHKGIRMALNGLPGTGKTFRLLKIGFWHALQGGSVLFACFNKTLATDIRRLVSLSPNINHVKKTFEVKDIFDIANVYGEILNLDPYDEDNTHDDWGDLIVQALAEGDLSTYRKFDTILIDEAQDMTEWQLELLRLHSNFDSSIWIAVGKGQELYGDGSRAKKWINDFTNDGNTQNLRRNFRNRKKEFSLARHFFDSYPDLHKLNNSEKRVTESEQLEFLRETGGLPKLEFVSYETTDRSIDDNIIQKYCSIISDTYNELDENEKPFDILILVPKKDSSVTRWVLQALDKFKKDTRIGYADYTQEKNRRREPLAEELRVVTFYSSRGLEGSKVLVFGLEQLPFFSENNASTKNMVQNKLAYIILSRAVYQTKIVLPENVNNRATEFLNCALEKVSKE